MADQVEIIDKSSDTGSIKWIEVIEQENAGEEIKAIEIQYKDFKLNIHAPLTEVLAALTKLL